MAVDGDRKEQMERGSSKRGCRDFKQLKEVYAVVLKLRSKLYKK